MSVESIEREIREQIAAKIRLAAEGPDRFRVFTPFVLDDGDHLSIVKRTQDRPAGRPTAGDGDRNCFRRRELVSGYPQTTLVPGGIQERWRRIPYAAN